MRSPNHQPGTCLGILEQLLKLINHRLEAASIANALHMKAGQLEAVIGALIIASSQPETMIDTAAEALGMPAARVREAVEAVGGVEAIQRLSERLNYPDHGLPAN